MTERQPLGTSIRCSGDIPELMGPNAISHHLLQNALAQNATLAAFCITAVANKKPASLF
jgi:hypothetical protein